jgi:hypothetical protein
MSKIEKQKGVQLRPEIRAFAERMERRMRGAARKVAAGEIPHLKFMSLGDLLAAFKRNADRVLVAAGSDGILPTRDRPINNDAADACNYLRLIAERLAEGCE